MLQHLVRILPEIRAPRLSGDEAAHAIAIVLDRFGTPPSHPAPEPDRTMLELAAASNLLILWLRGREPRDASNAWLDRVSRPMSAEHPAPEPERPCLCTPASAPDRSHTHPDCPVHGYPASREAEREPSVVVAGCPKGAARRHTWGIELGTPTCLRCGLEITTDQQATRHPEASPTEGEAER